jgi:hypothetical protein
LVLILGIYLKITKEQFEPEKILSMRQTANIVHAADIDTRLNAYINKQEKLIEPWPSRMDRMEAGLIDLQIRMAKIELKIDCLMKKEA